MDAPDYPLFPLQQFLLPGQRLRLQIFEPRYLSMITERLRSNATFGVVQIRDGREVGRAPLFFTTGTEAAIVDWNQLPNGLLGIEVEGRRRFRVTRSEVQGDQLLKAAVNWVAEEIDAPVGSDWEGLHQLLIELRQHPSLQGLKLLPPSTLSQLGWQLCLLLPLSMPDKMALWDLDSAELRLEHLADRVQRLTRE